MRVGVLHPGSMGAALSGCIGGETIWASEGRSAATESRANGAGIVDVGSQASLVETADVIISICPPAAAVDVAEQVTRLAFDGIYVDLNAVSPATARRIGKQFDHFVDGCVVGPPPSVSIAGASHSERGESRSSNDPGSETHLYLSGAEAPAIAALFAGSSVESRVIGSEPGRASALKMAYAAWTKGTSAMLLAVAAMASSENVSEELFDEWDASIPGLRERLEELSARIGKKAWRFEGEMEEIARTFGDSGLPDGFHLAASDIYSRIADLRASPSGRLPAEVIAILLNGDGHLSPDGGPSTGR